MPVPSIEDYGTPAHDAVVVTGPRFADLTWSLEIMRALDDEFEHGEFTLVHGDAAGLDRIAARCWRVMGHEVIAVPYFGWLGRSGGVVRNDFMLREYKPRAVLAFHAKSYEELPQPGSGTAHCFAQAMKLRIPRLRWTIVDFDDPSGETVTKTYDLDEQMEPLL